MSSIAASSSGSSSASALAQAQSKGTSKAGGIAFAGLGSGTDFGSMIDQLKKIEEIPKNRLELWKADWQKRVDAFDELITSITDLSKKFSGMDSMSNFLTKIVNSTKSTAISAVATSDAPIGSYKLNVTQLATNGLLTTQGNVCTTKDQVIAPDKAYQFSYTYGDTTRNLTVPQGTSMQSFLNIINNDTRNPGVSASLIKSGNGYVFQLQGKATGENHALKLNAATTVPGFCDPANAGSALTDADKEANNMAFWYDRKAQDCKFYLEGRQNQILSSSSNQLTDVVPGLTITVADVTDDLDASGNIISSNSVMLTVTNDTASAKEKVMEFVDGVNELLTKFQELTKYDKSKKASDIATSSSQFSAQKGSVLTGNYGVQLLYSRIRSACVGTAKGFIPLEKDGTGDPLWMLARAGIQVDADESSKTFGQLIVKEGESEIDSPFRTIDEALKDNPEELAELLAGDKLVRGNSPDFSYVGMLNKDMLAGGQHNVQYSVVAGAAPGDPPLVNRVLIDGVAASYDSTNNEWTSTANGSKGLVIRIDNMTVGNHSGTLSVKQGKINELNEMLKKEIKGANLEVGKQTDDKGSLLVLKENYLDIIDSIDKKLAKEESRLILWETRMRAQFARLDTLLAKYDKQMSANASSLASAGSWGSSKK